MDVQTHTARDGSFYIAKNGDTLEISIIGAIGWDFSSKDISEKLAENPDVKEIIVKINSPGGDAFEGITIYNMLKEAKAKITVEILGAALSAASIIAMAGDEVKMAKNAMLMIHNPFTGAHGDANKLRKTAETLDQLTDNLANIYKAKTGIDVKQLKKMMDDETWLNAIQAKKQGFIDKVMDTSKNEIFFNLTEFHFKNIPESYSQEKVLSTEPYGWDFSSNPEYDNINAVRIGLAVTGDSGYEELYNKFKKQNPDYNKKIELKIGQNIYPLSEKDVAMINQFVKLSGKETPEDALAYFKDLNEREPEVKVEFKSDPEVQNLLKAQGDEIKTFKSELERKDKTIEDLTNTVKDATDFIKNSKKEKRQVELNELLNEGFINAAQLELAEATFYEMSDEVYKAKIDFMKAGGPVFKSLQTINGTDIDGKPVDNDPVSEFENAIDEALKSDNKLTYEQAVDFVVNEKPELFEAYDKAITK